MAVYSLPDMPYDYLLADLALGLVRAQTGQSLDDLVRELTLLVATTPPPPPG